MSITKLPSGRWRAQVHVPGKGNVSVGVFDTKREAKEARENARKQYRQKQETGVTIGEFWQRWTTDRLYQREKLSTNIHNAERTRKFAEKYATVPVRAVGDEIVSEWLTGGNNVGTVPALRAMFNDAASAKSGRLIERNPFANLGIRKGSRKHQRPPAMADIKVLVAHAKLLTPASFAAFLEFACLTGARPGELDALRWGRIDLEANDVHIMEQWNAKTGGFTSPKYGPYTLALVPQARDVIVEAAPMGKTPDPSDFVFRTLRGTHYTPTARTHHWNRVRAAAGMGNTSFYLATRHAFASYALNVLRLPPHIIAEQLGHRDGGRLVSQLYGHPDAALARDRIRRAFAESVNVVELPDRREETA